VPHHRFEEFLFVREIEIERALGDAGAARYVVEPRRGEAALGKAGQRRGDDLAGTVLFAAPPANGRLARSARINNLLVSYIFSRGRQQGIGYPREGAQG
jgi:hypothetical protein